MASTRQRGRERTSDEYTLDICARRPVRMPARFMNEQASRIDAAITQRLREMVGDRCDHQGFVFADSIQLVWRDTGELDTVLMDGGIVYRCQYTYQVYVLNEGDALRCTVLHSNDAGVLCKYAGDSSNSELHLNIVVPTQLNNQGTRPENGETVLVRVVGTRFQPGQTIINVVATLSDGSDLERPPGDLA